MAGSLAEGASQRWKNAADFVDRVYGELMSYHIPLGYEQTRDLVSDGRQVDVYLEGSGSLGEGIDGEKAADDLDRLTMDGENVEHVDVHYRYGVFSDRFDASIRIVQDGEDYTLDVEGRR